MPTLLWMPGPSPRFPSPSARHWVQWAREWHGPVMVLFLGGPLTIFLAVGFHPAANQCWKFLCNSFESEEPLSGNRSEWNQLALLCQCCIFFCFSHMCFASAAFFLPNLLYPHVSTPSGETGRNTSRNFSCMATTSCMSVVVSNVGAEWLVGGKILCSVLMACYRCFLHSYQITITLQVRLRTLRLEF